MSLVKTSSDINSKKIFLEQKASKYFGVVSEKTDVNRSVLISRGNMTESFYTEDSKLYITPRESRLLSKGVKLDREVGKWDSLSRRIVGNYIQYSPSKASLLHKQFEKSYKALQDDLAETSRTILGQFSVVRLWNLSIVGSILLGMFSMTMIYRYLGQGAAANEIQARARTANELSVANLPGIPRENEGRISGDDPSVYMQHIIGDIKSDKKDELESEIRAMVKGYPIEDMVAYIAEKDRVVAAFLIAIAKKESNWGKRVPLLEGQDCNNYWGYRGIRKLMGTGGHTCFNSRKDAVDTVAKRIETLVKKYELDTPEKMVVWKCGSNCAVTGGQAAANKWIKDVDMYFKELK